MFSQNLLNLRYKHLSILACHHLHGSQQNQHSILVYNQEDIEMAQDQWLQNYKENKLINFYPYLK